MGDSPPVGAPKSIKSCCCEDSSHPSSLSLPLREGCDAVSLLSHCFKLMFTTFIPDLGEKKSISFGGCFGHLKVALISLFII